MPTGWERITGPRAIEDAPLALARSLSETPDDASRKLNAPAAIGVLDLAEERLVVANDALGAARAYEAESGGVRAWSNRPGALVVFLGMDARADARAWRVLAAASWFLGDTAPIEAHAAPAGRNRDRGGARAASRSDGPGRSPNGWRPEATSVS